MTDENKKQAEELTQPPKSKRHYSIFYDESNRLFRNQLKNDLALIEFGSAPTATIQRLTPAKIVLDSDSSNRVDYATLWGIEGLLLPLLPDWLIPDRIEKLRGEYQRLATAESYIDYMKDPKPDPKDSSQLRAHAIGLLGDVQRLRMGRSLLLSIRLWNSAFILAITIPIVLWLLFDDPISRDVYTLPTLAIYSGLFGACLSVLSRLYSIPIKGDLIERFRNNAQRVFAAISPLLSIIEGGIAALVMLFILQSSYANALFAQDILPKFHQFQTSTIKNSDTASSQPPSSQPVELAPPPGATTLPAELDQSTKGNIFWETVAVPQSSVDIAKIIIWCFLAGFSERLIPDMLSQLANKASKRS